VRLTFSAEQEQFRGSIRAFLRDRDIDARVRATIGSTQAAGCGHDTETWHAMAERIGLQGLTVPEAFGGSGYGQQELAVVLEELGRTLACGAYFPTVVLAVNALMLSRDERAQAEYLPGIADGSTIATVALTDGSASWSASGLTVRAHGGQGARRLTGSQSFVLAGHVADLILLVADGGPGPSLYAVLPSGPGVTVTPLTSMDLTRPQADVTLRDAPGRLVGAPGAGLALFARLLDLAGVGLAAEQVGGAQRVLEMAVEYAKTRTQFGREIGSFQAIKHKCADMLIEVESARSCAYYAALAAATESPDLHTAASLAQLRCSQAYLRAAEENILVHGAIGFTWEYPAQLSTSGPARTRSTSAGRHTTGSDSPSTSGWPPPAPDRPDQRFQAQPV
jgi:alkylation response protein AidB-like acyl-CoA dehydrogenase